MPPVNPDGLAKLQAAEHDEQHDEGHDEPHPDAPAFHDEPHDGGHDEHDGAPSWEAPPRPIHEIEGDVRAIVRCVGYGFELARVRRNPNRRPRLDTIDRAAAKVARVARKVQGKPSLSGWIDWVGVAADVVCGFVEDELDAIRGAHKPGAMVIEGQQKAEGA